MITTILFKRKQKRLNPDVYLQPMVYQKTIVELGSRVQTLFDCKQMIFDNQNVYFATKRIIIILPLSYTGYTVKPPHNGYFAEGGKWPLYM